MNLARTWRTKRRGEICGRASAGESTSSHYIQYFLTSTEAASRVGSREGSWKGHVQLKALIIGFDKLKIFFIFFCKVIFSKIG